MHATELLCERGIWHNQLTDTVGRYMGGCLNSNLAAMVCADGKGHGWDNFESEEMQVARLGRCFDKIASLYPDETVLLCVHFFSSTPHSTSRPCRQLLVLLDIVLLLDSTRSFVRCLS